VPKKHVEAWKVLEKLKEEGKVKSIGLSNYTIEDYKELKAVANVPPSINQIEVNPFLYRKKTIEYFQKEGVAIQAYRPLRQGKEMQHPKIVELAAKYGRTSSQILGRWLIQKQIIYIPKSEKVERMKENATVTDFEMSADDMSQLDRLTIPAALEDFKVLYEKCVVRDTPLEATKEGIKKNITLN
jgi:diketogulonate reductase-like aldo/keto reductase